MNNSEIVVCQYWTNNLSYGKYTEAINRKYCEDNGYIYHIETNTDKIISSIDGRAITWYKPKLIKEVFEIYNPKYVFFLDADAIICNFSYKIQDFIDENFDVICTEDHGPSVLNAGVFIFKNTEWVKNLMDYWWEICDVLRGGQNHEKGFYKNGLWHDQTCFGHIMINDEICNKKIKKLSNKVLNGREYKHPIDNNFIFHAFAFGMFKNRTIDNAYYDIFKIEPDIDTDNLLELAETYPTDKHYFHNYFKHVYQDLFRPIKNEVKKFLEIGVYDGNSTKIFKRYFKNSLVYGIDIVKPIIDEGINYIHCDQSNPKELEDTFKELNDLDIILDDGSHKMYDQQITFAIGFKKLKSNGIYIIEDLHTSLECLMPDKQIFQWGDPKKITTLQMLELFNKNKIIESDYISDEDKEYLKNNIKSCEIYYLNNNQSVTSVIIKK